jgi:hypothetical protein
VAEAVRTGQALDFVKPGEVTLTREISAFLSDAKLKRALDRIIAEEPNAQRRSFRMASHIANELTYRLIAQFQRRIAKGNLIDAFQTATGLLPVGFGILPYVVAFGQQAPDRAMLAQVARDFTGEVPRPLRNEKRAWFTDTLEDVNGVARTIRAMAHAASASGADLTVVTSRSKLLIDDIPIKNFAPVGEFEIPEYELQKLSFPPFLDMLDYVQREGFTELIISTPGPIGLCALGCAKLLGLRTSGIYHTDFPQYARFLSDDAFMETLVWNYMQWFYGQVDMVYVNSEFYRRRWVDRGIAPEKLRIFPRGLDTELFNPKHRDEKYWAKRGAKGPVLLYVGRVSREKDLQLLIDVLPALRKRVAKPFTLVLVGEGHPDRPRAGHRLCLGRPVCFPEHDRHLRQRGDRGDGGRPARGGVRRRRSARAGEEPHDGPRPARARCRGVDRRSGRDAGPIAHARGSAGALRSSLRRAGLGGSLHPLLGGRGLGSMVDRHRPGVGSPSARTTGSPGRRWCWGARDARG